MNYYVCVDLGGTNLRVGLIDDELNIVKIYKEKSIHDDQDLLYSQIKKLIDKLEICNYNVLSIGLSLCGIEDNGYLTYAPNLNITNFNLKERLLKDFNLKINMANDANAACLCEAYLGNCKEDKNILFTTISTGLGAGLVYNHKLINLPFESGHQLITYKEHDYDVENILSGTGLVKLSALNNLIVSSSLEFFNLVKENNALALKVLDDYTTLLAKFYYNQQVNFNVDSIILSGGMMKSKDYFYDSFINKFYALLEKIPVKKPRFVDATFDQDAGLFGAYAVAKYF